ncbi:unnamed protein product [Protopolystoma xenopodis]|uniref:Uncharacterized protein n=1 Tax=Protopolystoma xenopodis TaxID=117903 RepID=A0A448WM07_9PLAT|nr:unnamed protein product [Protopolystoma xenopodis]
MDLVAKPHLQRTVNPLTHSPAHDGLVELPWIGAPFAMGYKGSQARPPVECSTTLRVGTSSPHQPCYST